MGFELAQLAVKRLSAEDKLKVREFLEKSYYPDDPVLQAMNVKHVDESQHEHVLGIIDEGYSYAAVSDNDTILGVVLIGEINRNGVQNLQKELERCTSEYFSKLLRFYMTMSEGAKLFDISECEKALEFHIAAVSPPYRRNGIMRKLFVHGMEIARLNGYKMTVVTCASQYTTNLCKSLDWNCVYCLPYVYYELDGERLFKNPVDPHLYSRIYIQNV